MRGRDSSKKNSEGTPQSWMKIAGWCLGLFLTEFLNLFAAVESITFASGGPSRLSVLLTWVVAGLFVALLLFPGPMPRFRHRLRFVMGVLVAMTAVGPLLTDASLIQLAAVLSIPLVIVVYVFWALGVVSAVPATSPGARSDTSV